MVKTIDLAWLGGLLEGDGCFMLKQGKYAQIGLEMTSEDIVIKVSDMWNTRVVKSRNLYVTRVNGFKAVKWMMLLLPFLGERRREKIASIIKVWKETTHVNADGARRMATCHPDRLAYGFGMCQSCYDKDYYKEHRKKDKQLLRKVG